MPRRQGSTFDETFEFLKLTPIWVGPILAGILFALLRFVAPLFVPAKLSGVDPGVIFLPLLLIFSWLLPAVVLLAWIAAELWKFQDRRLLANQTGLASIKEISWRDFERLVSEAYRRRGYVAELLGGSSADGGVDIRLRGHDETVLIQCKQWKGYTVGVTTVRELLGVVVSEKASRGIVVTSGRFTQEALAFAKQNPQVELLDGPALAELIRDVKAGIGQPPLQPPPSTPLSVAPACPVCGNLMVLRMARKGPNAGSNFWGCSKFSTTGCRGIRTV